MVAPLIVGAALKAAKSKTGKKILGKAGKALGGILGGKGASHHKRRRLSINRKVQQLIRAKIDGKIMKAKYGALLR